VRESCEKQLQAMLNQYNDKLGTYESNLKDQTLKMVQVLEESRQAAIKYKEVT
jgi:hypothetical protein